MPCQSSTFELLQQARDLFASRRTGWDARRRQVWVKAMIASFKTLIERPEARVGLWRLSADMQDDFKKNRKVYSKSLHKPLKDLVLNYVAQSRPSMPRYRCAWTEDNGLWYTPWALRNKRTVVSLHNLDGQHVYASIAPTVPYMWLPYRWYRGKGRYFGEVRVQHRGHRCGHTWYASSAADVTLKYKGRTLPVTLHPGQTCVLVEADNALTLFLSTIY